MRFFKRPLRPHVLCAFGVASGWLVLSAASAQAAIIETSTITNYVNYYTNYATDPDDVFVEFGAGNFNYTGSHSSSAGGASFVDIGVTTSLDSNGNFFFLHNATCVGSCYIDIGTEIRFSVTNTGSEAEQLSFNSLITPGHIARQNYIPGQGEATFNFQIFDQDTYRTSVDDALFSALGEANPNAARIRDGVYTTSDPTYRTKDGSTFASQNKQISNEGNVLDRNSPPAATPNYNVLDWSATGVGVNLPTILPGQTRTIIYYLNTYVSIFDTCPTFESCNGFQVAFGDPRNNGSVEPAITTPDFLSLGDSAAAQLGALDLGYNPVVGAKYDPYLVTVSLGDVDDPVGNPPANAPIQYDGIFVPTIGGNVPEPSTWAMLILGFGAVGGALRRRSREARVASA